MKREYSYSIFTMFLIFSFVFVIYNFIHINIHINTNSFITESKTNLVFFSIISSFALNFKNPNLFLFLFFNSLVLIIASIFLFYSFEKFTKFKNKLPFQFLNLLVFVCFYFIFSLFVMKFYGLELLWNDNVLFFLSVLLSMSYFIKVSYFEFKDTDYLFIAFASLIVSLLFLFKV